MADQREPSKYVNLVVPPILFGGNSRGLLNWMKLRSQRVSSTSDTWRVCTEENYYARPRAGLLIYKQLSGFGMTEDRIDQVLGQPPKGFNVTASEEAIQRVNALTDELEESAEIADMFTHFRLATMVASDEQLPEILKTAFDSVRAVPFRESPDERPFADASVHLAERDPAMIHRIKFPSVWLRFDYDPRLASGDRPMNEPQSSDVPQFASALELHSGMMTFDTYFGPMAGCLSPFVWCIVSTRGRGVIVMDLGTVLSGTRSQVGELLHTLPIHGSDGGVKRPDLAAPAFGAAVAWWTDRLDDLFGVLTDPAVFAGEDGTYNAASHLHALLTVEQLFRRVASIQAAARDTHAARVLLFSVLDTVQRLTGRPMEANCSAKFATKTLDSLRQAIPAPARELLLWGPERTLSALEKVQDGFFLRHLNDDRVAIRDNKGNERTMDLDMAAAHYLKVIRDATHGHGSNHDKAKGKTNALLAQHDGYIPHEIAGLGFLYLLDVLSRPDIVRRLLSSNARST